MTRIEPRAPLESLPYRQAMLENGLRVIVL
jgi:hypothetical protein